MDANGSRFHLLLGRDDWGRARVGDTTLAAAWHASPRAEVPFDWNTALQALVLTPLVPRFPRAPSDRAPDLDARRGAAMDRHGTLYWIGDDEASIQVRSAGTGTAARFWPDASRLPAPPAGDFTPVDERPAAPVRLAGLAVTEDHHLVVGTRSPGGLLVFDLVGGGAPFAVTWPASADFDPLDMAPRAGGGLVILDRGTPPRFWVLDRTLRVVTPGAEEIELAPERVEDFRDEAGAARVRPREVFRGGSAFTASPIEGFEPLAIEVLADDTVLVLGNATGTAAATLAAYRDGAPLGVPERLDEVIAGVEEDAREDFVFRAHDMALVRDAANPRRGRVFVAGSEGNQAFVVAVDAHDDGLAVALERWRSDAVRADRASYWPMRRFTGRGLAAYGNAVHYDSSNVWVPLAAQDLTRHARQGTLVTETFDGREPDCVWHRLALDACLPPGTRVRVRSRAADSEALLALAAWQDEPEPYLRGDGAEIPWHRPTTGRGPHAGTWELLFQAARGRYLQLALTLEGDGQATPHVAAARLWYPRFSYLAEYLPAVYREEPQSASFLERFLANLEGLDTSIEDRIAAAQALFDERSAPREALDWLAAWFGVAMDPAWDERRRRLFIRHAATFFRLRGTVHGLRLALALALDPCVDEALFEEAAHTPARPYDVRIVERFLTRRLDPVELGDPLAPAAPRVAAAAARWSPDDGAAALAERYRRFLADAGVSAAPADFPLAAPADADAAERWQRFSMATLGFMPSAVATPRTLARWRAFLARRHLRIRNLNARWLTAWTRFEDVPWPATLPAGREPLADWYQFHAVANPIDAAAHRFSVLLPTPGPGRALDDLRRRIAIANRVVALEKPAHTVFDVRPYWALFRIGAARVGLDTLLDVGSRSPALAPPAVLGDAYLGESRVAPLALPDRPAVVLCP